MGLMSILQGNAHSWEENLRTVGSQEVTVPLVLKYHQCSTFKPKKGTCRDSQVKIMYKDIKCAPLQQQRKLHFGTLFLNACYKTF